jgi:hypothetical protein
MIVKEDTISKSYSVAKKKVRNGFLFVCCGIVPGLVVFVFSFIPGLNLSIDVSVIVENLTAISISVTVLIFLCNQIAERRIELQDIGNGEVPEEKIELWFTKLLAYKVALFFIILAIILSAFVGTTLVASLLFDMFGHVHSNWLGGKFARFGTGTYLIFVSLILSASMIQVDPDPTLQGNVLIYKELRLRMYINKKKSTLERMQNGLNWWPKKIEVKNNWWNIVIALLFLVGMLILIGLSAVYAHENNADYIIGVLSAILLFGSVIALTFLNVVYPALLVVDKYSIDGLYSRVMLFWCAVAYLIILVNVAVKACLQLPDSVELERRIFIFIGLAITPGPIFILMSIFINYQRKEYNDWRQNKTAFNEKAPILFRSAVKAVEDYKRKIDELQRELDEQKNSSKFGLWLRKALNSNPHQK